MSRRNLTVDEAMQRASRLAEKGKTQEAAQLYEEVLRASPDHKKARKALRALRPEAAARTRLTEADFQRVATLMSQRKLDAARTEIQRLCRLHPDEPALHNLRGVILSRRGNRDDALDAFREALRLEPAFAEALNNLASVLADSKRYGEALGCYQELVNRGQADADVYANLARALRGDGQSEKAEEALRRAIALRPLFPDAYNDLGNLLNDTGRHDEAIAAYEQALQMAPTHATALRNLGQSLGKMQRHNAALTIYRQLLEIRPDDLQALRGMAQSLAAIGQRSAAIGRYEEILKRDPGDVVSKLLLAALRGDTPAAADPGYAKAVFESYAANFEAHLTATLEYRLPEHIPALLEKLDGEDAWYSRALDLGCGTGLLGAQVRSYCDNLTGIDVAEAMIAKARQKAVYDRLIVGDMKATLEAEEGLFDLVLCADVLVYVGELQRLFHAVRQRCHPGCSFLFSTELLGAEQVAELGARSSAGASATDSGLTGKSEGGNDYRLLPSGRFAHSDAYVKRCAGETGFSLRHSEHLPLRKDRGSWLTGGLYVLSAV